MTAVEGGDFEEGVRLMNRILAVRGQVVPVSPTPLTLHARLADGTVVDGQSRDHAHAGHRARLAHARTTSRPPTDALAAIAEAELIVIGPGSLYTSLLPSLLHPEHPRRARWRTPAPRVFVCNVATQAGETTGFDLAGHVEALVAHTRAGHRRHRPRQQPVRRARTADARWRAERGRGCAGRRRSSRSRGSILDDVVDPDNAHHHDPARLAARDHRGRSSGETGIRRRTTGRSATPDRLR